MKKYINWLLWVPSLVFFLYMAVIEMPKAGRHLENVVENPTCASIPDLFLFGISMEAVTESLTCMGTAGIDKYIHIATHEDSIFPLAFGLFFALTLFFLISYTVEQKRIAWSLALVPVIAALADYYENMNMIQVASQFPDLDPEIVFKASVGNIWKWLFLTINTILLVVYGFRALVFLIDNRKS